ncbi:Putative indigoidine synthase IndC [Streptomyces davaonensis JCM 4913]|uniref:Putative indigoidine synthase IndC n=1 Tax=Streptomyces davaonensis (strain DSM 101723 / JCM 4913 / KCC S-0913 / 768) TaxID=1214101 RepID=K4RGM4_STRDJ|nr:amino acid adenylation domain-containing protein [Streptomyces davaonensis]CCK32349.1 Putative indigoidine synthase IndC [Streptomyces davaonensis JCM 4913]
MLKTQEAAGTCLPDLLNAQARARPGELAVVHEGESLTFRELADQADDVARFLHHLGIRAEGCVGLFVEPSLDLVIGAWGVLRSGGAFLPLSPDYPRERLRHVARDARTGVVLTQEHLRGRLAEFLGAATAVITLEDVVEFRKSRSGADPAELPAGPRPADLAYILYTSGSTGSPKGVAIEHRSLTHQMRWLADTFALDADRTVLHKTPIGFDAAQWEILANAWGSRVVVGSGGIHRDPVRLIETVARHGVTTLQCVPTLLQALVDTDELDRCTSLVHLFSGGEALSRSLARRLNRALPNTTLVNLYGPTECTINTSAHVVDPAALGKGPETLPIGTPVTGLRYHILDVEGRPVKAGETGELHISGVQLARGYLHRPDLTVDRFRPPADGRERLYRTGDLAHWNPDGSAQFVGRADNQVKLRGFRIELDEIRLAIEAHDWVRNAAVLLRTDPLTEARSLVACIELSPREAALMDQGEFGAHHVSKSSRLQVRAQLSNPGVRQASDLSRRPALPLPGATPSPEQRRRAFARKTYRFYDGGPLRAEDVLAAIERRTEGAPARRPEALTVDELGALLRDFGQYTSDQRLLPKYAYASPGSLYAAQLYLELNGLAGLATGHYYYHPIHHELVLIRRTEATELPRVRVHFVGRTPAIEPVYKKNVQEVLEMEAGHMAGLFDEVLPAHGLALAEAPYDTGLPRLLDCGEDDHYLGSYDVVPWTAAPSHRALDIYVQFHPGSAAGLPGGQYRYRDGGLHRISGQLILKRHVIAINQAAYDRSGFGITLVSRAGEQAGYADLGRELQRLMMNTARLGLMPAGYSSRSGDDLPAARRMAAILSEAELPAGPSYFCVGGTVSEAQLRHEGMDEDQVHMKGPEELIRDDLVGSLPEYMLPSRILIVPELPHTPNGKLDSKALEGFVEEATARARPVVEPRDRTEARLCGLWQAALKRDFVSVHDDFFQLGGNSLIAVALVKRVNEAFGCALPLQVLFEATTVAKLAEAVSARAAIGASRITPLRPGSDEPPVFCWPGLGGVTMNLRLLAARAPGERPVLGIQARGVNEGETPLSSVEEMAAEDVAALRRVQPQGPYTLWGYSFGARVAYEAARQLEASGERVERVFLLAPGAPRVPGAARPTARTADFADPAFTTVLFSVFAGTVRGPAVEECLRHSVDAESFSRFVEGRFPQLDPGLIRRVVAVVCRTYGFTYDRTLPAHQLRAPVTVFRAHDDEPSFIEGRFGPTVPDIVQLETDHYGALREPGVGELARALQRATPRTPAQRSRA